MAKKKTKATSKKAGKKKRVSARPTRVTKKKIGYDDSALRLIATLQYIPTEAPGVTTAQINEMHNQHGGEISLRTTQRDLNSLEKIFDIKKSGKKSPRWYWEYKQGIAVIPAHDQFSALTWNLLEQYLEPLLPWPMRSSISPHFATARHVLEQGSTPRLDRWRSSVRIIPSNLQLRQPRVEESVTRIVYEGIWHGEQITLHYRKRGADSTGRYDIDPCGIVVRGNIVYLVGRVHRRDTIQQFALHRAESAAFSGREADIPEDFDLDEYIREGNFNYVEGEEIDLVLHMDNYVAQHLVECPINETQQVVPVGENECEVHVRVLDTQQLRWWLQGYGSRLRVLAPDSLKSWLREEVETLQHYYARG